MPRTDALFAFTSMDHSDAEGLGQVSFRPQTHYNEVHIGIGSIRDGPTQRLKLIEGCSSH